MKVKHILVIIIICIAIFLRLYKLDSIPPGLSQDETSIGYNAYSLIKTGKDEHGVFFPQNFKAFGEYKLPGYIYLSTISIAILGTTPLAVRLPSALFGTLTVLLIYFLVKELFSGTKNYELKTKNLPMTAMLLLAINPWHLHLSRGAFEVTVALFFITAGFLLWLIAQKRTSALCIGLSITAFAFAGYTYNIARLLGPLSILFLACTSYPTFKQFRLGSWIVIVLFGICSFAPMLLGMIGQGGLSSTSGTMIWSSAYVQAPLLEWRSYFSLWPILLTKIVFNKPLLTLGQFLHNFINFFSPSFFFTTGSLHGNHGIGTVGQWYAFELLTILMGLIYALKRKGPSIFLLFFWIVTTAIIVSLTRESPHGTRAFFIVIPGTILSAIGFQYIFHIISSRRSVLLRYVCFTFAFFLCSWQVFNYFASYYVRFPIMYAKPWRTADKELALYLKEHEREYDRIFIDNQSGFIYTSLAYYFPLNPVQFQQNTIWNKEDSEGFSFPQKIQKYEFRIINWSEDMQSPKTLIVTTGDKMPNNVALLKTFYYPQRPVVVAAGQQLYQYPTSDTAYVLVENK